MQDNSWLQELALILDDIYNASNVTYNEKVRFASLIIKRNGLSIVSGSVVPLCKQKESISTLVRCAYADMSNNSKPLH